MCFNSLNQEYEGNFDFNENPGEDPPNNTTFFFF
jgi:hypothetical protein